MDLNDKIAELEARIEELELRRELLKKRIENGLNSGLFNKEDKRVLRVLSELLV